MDEFKEIHKQVEQLRSSGFNTDDIKRDITSMEDEKEHLSRRVEKLKKKVHLECRFLSIFKRYLKIITGRIRTKFWTNVSSCS